jgi:hypothetical protein
MRAMPFLCCEKKAAVSRPPWLEFIRTKGECVYFIGFCFVAQLAKKGRFCSAEGSIARAETCLLLLRSQSTATLHCWGQEQDPEIEGEKFKYKVASLFLQLIYRWVGEEVGWRFLQYSMVYVHRQIVGGGWVERWCVIALQGSGGVVVQLLLTATVRYRVFSFA